MATKTDKNLIKLGEKMDKYAQLMRDIYYELGCSDNPKARLMAQICNGNNFDLWCGFASIAEDAIKENPPADFVDPSFDNPDNWSDDTAR